MEHDNDYFNIDLPTTETVIERVNDGIDKLYYKVSDVERKPYVCAVCDRFILNLDDICNVAVDKMKRFSCIKWSNFEDNLRPDDVKSYYKFNRDDIDSNIDLSFTDDMALSPRTLLIRRKKIIILFVVAVVQLLTRVHLHFC